MAPGLAIPLVRRVGHIRAFAFCAALAAITALLHVLIVDPWVWLGLRVLYGLALVSLYMVIESWLNAQVPNEKRGQVFAVYMAVNLGALAAAQQLLNLASPSDFVLFVLAAMLISAALMPITLTRQIQPSVPDTLHTNLRQIAGIAPYGAGRRRLIRPGPRRLLGHGAGVRQPERLRCHRRGFC